MGLDAGELQRAGAGWGRHQRQPGEGEGRFPISSSTSPRPEGAPWRTWPSPWPTAQADGDRHHRFRRRAGKAALREAGRRSASSSRPTSGKGSTWCSSCWSRPPGVMGTTPTPRIIEGHHRYKVDAPSGTAPLPWGGSGQDAQDVTLKSSAPSGREGITGERGPQHHRLRHHPAPRIWWGAYRHVRRHRRAGGDQPQGRQPSPCLPTVRCRPGKSGSTSRRRLL